ncbi:MAG TPA: amino acid ABC transporter permease [Tianweitania sediminis]|jgi:polar amino acid transport system permease protein|nr:amino acid ABC transporter permease [Tianweitania sediminis]
MEAIENWFLWLYDTTDINLSIVYDSYDRGRFLAGILLTLELAVICIVASIVIGVVGAWLQGSQFRLTNAIVRGYVALFRNTPPIVQLFFFFFAIGGVLTFQTGDGTFRLSNFTWAAISLSFYYGSFNIENFRASIEAVPDTTVQAAEALGYKPYQIYSYVVLPLAFRFSLPGLGNNLVSLVKATSLAYAIAVPELLYVSSEIWGDQLNVPEMMWVIMFFYLFIVGLLVYGMRKLEARLHIPGYSYGSS